MIEVTYHRQKNYVQIKGHANSAPYGHDLVCAAVSAIALTLAGNVSYMETQDAVRNVVIKLDEGNAEIRCVAGKKYKESVGQVFRSICIGFELLSTKYPENISYVVRG